MADQELDNQPEQPEQPAVPEEPKTDPDPQEPEPKEPDADLEEPEQPEEPETPQEPREPRPQDPEQPMSRRKAKRLEKLEGLVQHLRGTQAPQTQQKSDGIDYRQMIDADDQVYDQLAKASQEFGQTQFNAGLEQANSVRFHTRLEIDAPRVESKYPQLNKESPEFDPAATNAINEWYLATVGYDPNTDTVKNPNVRYANFVEGIMELADAMAGAKTTRSTENIARQAANAGLRPDGSSAKPLNWQGKAPEDMTEAELTAAVNATMPRDARGRFTSQK